MLNLAERYWNWRNRPKPKQVYFVTDQGFTVRQFGENWAVCSVSRLTGKYIDLTGSYAWRKDDRWFRDCVASQGEIENKYGKILGLEPDVEETEK